MGDHAGPESRRRAPRVQAQVQHLRLLGGRLCLDFVNTIEPRHGDRSQEFLTTYADLVAWAAHAGAVTEDDVRPLLERAKRTPAVAAATLATALELRQQLYRLFSGIGAGQPPDRSALAAVNRALAAASPHAQIIADGPGHFRWEWSEARDLDRVWWPVTRSAAELLVSGHLDRLRECPGPDGCGWLFYDTSRNGRRRWCSMEGCGNRAKGQRHYQRLRSR